MGPEKKTTTGKTSLLDQWLSRNKKEAENNRIQPLPPGAAPVLSSGQQRLWFLDQLYPDNPFYHFAEIWRLHGALDTDRLIESFRYITRRHQILRTTFNTRDGKVIQDAGAAPDLDFAIHYLDHLPAEQMEEAVKRLALKEARRPFDLSRGPLGRILLFRLSEDQHQLAFIIHHISIDKWSVKVLYDELSAVYRAMCSGEAVALPPLPFQYADYAYWQRGQAANPADLAYWREELAGELPVLELPADHPRPSRPGFGGAFFVRDLSGTLSRELKSLSKKADTTLFVLLLSAYKVLLYRYTGQEDILVGAPFSNRDQLELEKLIGFFNETLVLRSDLSGDPGFLELVGKVRQTVLRAFAHKSLPFDSLVQALKPDRYLSSNPLFQVMFLYHKTEDLPDLGPGLTMERQFLDLGVSKFDLTLYVEEGVENLSLLLEYSTDLFEEATIGRMFRHFENLLEGIVRQPDLPVSSLPMLTEQEHVQLIQEWNDTRTDPIDIRCIHHLIEARAAQNPTGIAVICRGEILTYEALNERAGAIAGRLLAAGMKRNDPVGLFAERSLDMMAGMVGILKAGGAYLPLDPEYPPERTLFMVRDAGVELVLTQGHLRDRAPEEAARLLIIEESASFPADWDHQLSEGLNGSDLAYIIYTSGSTGRPKGVPVTHGNLVHSTMARFKYYPEHPGCFLLLSSFAFDSSVAGIFWTLCGGGTLLLPERRIEQDMDRLATVIAENGVTHTLLLPSLYSLLLEQASTGLLEGLNTVIVAGEACAAALCRRHFGLLPHVALYNEYGPTEATVWCTVHRIRPEDADRAVPIGRPVPNAEIYLLDRNGRPVPIGVAGELYVGGAGVTGQYLNRPELSDTRFVEHPFSADPSARLYRTGDLARYRADGVIEFIGRADHQVKIRGFRIEPDEIREVLLTHPVVREAVVAVRKASEDDSRSGYQTQRLVAYLTAAEDPAPISEIRRFIRERLPDYMVPPTFVQLEEFPRLPNGKIDLNALPAPEETSPLSASDFTGPETPLEKKLAEIWESVLNVRPIGRHDNFFDIGGDSVLSIQIVAGARRAGLVLASNQLFEHQTIAELALSIETTDAGEEEPEIIPAPQVLLLDRYPAFRQRGVEELFPLTNLQQALLFHHLQEREDQGLLQLVFTLAGTIDYALFRQAWEAAAMRHPVLRTSIHWEGLETPLQAVNPPGTIPWTYRDVRSFSHEWRKRELKEFRKEDLARGMDLSVSPLSRMAFFRLEEEETCLVWTCHHILIDGWSAGVILKDVVRFYDAAAGGREFRPAALPSFGAFLAWREGLELSDAERFWKAAFEGFDSPSLAGKTTAAFSLASADFRDLAFSLSRESTACLMTWTRDRRITAGALIHGLWGVLLGQYLQRDEVAFGTTASGRSANFPGLDRIAGLFMTVLPVRVSIDPDRLLGGWLIDLQQELTRIRDYETIDLEQITAWTGRRELFDTLLVFGNFLWDEESSKNISVRRYSGGFTSTYPLTLRAKSGNEFSFDLRYDANRVPAKVAAWFVQQFSSLLNAVCEQPDVTIADLLKGDRPPLLPSYEIQDTGNEKKQDENPVQPSYAAPGNETELRLTRIWESLLGLQPVGIRDDFFKIGGRSLTAVRLFGQIEQQFGCKLPPILLLQHPTIEALALLLEKEGDQPQWSSLVPLRAMGDKRPLFCIHAGGGHVFFYNALTRHLGPDQPVYALQPVGLDGSVPFHQSMEEMAAHYVKEIRTVQPQGPYALLGTCFSNSVCLEMAHQLNEQGQQVSLLAMIDSGPGRMVPLPSPGKIEQLREMGAMLAGGDWNGFGERAVFLFNVLRRKAGLKREPEKVGNLQELEDALTVISLKYKGKPYEQGKITLIRSKEFADRTDKDHHIERWKVLARQGLDVFVVPGHHVTLFEEPEVQGLARVIEGLL